MRLAGNTRGIRTGSPDRRDHEIAFAEPFDVLPDLHHLADGFMTEDQIFQALRRGAKLEADDVAVRAANSHLERMNQDLLRRIQARFRNRD